MSDLTEYDREIVAAAEEFISKSRGCKPANIRLVTAVQAKRDAQRPKCGFFMLTGRCESPAVQEVVQPDNDKRHFCDEHRIEVREL